MSVSPDEARFWPKIIKGPRTNDCWPWTGAVGDDGYGRYWIKTAGGQQALRPQRYAYLLLTGEQLPADIKLMHSCDIPLCVRATGREDSTCSREPRQITFVTAHKKDATPTPIRGVGAAPDTLTSPHSRGSSATLSKSTAGTNQ